ncbi:MAG: hypothetical protein K0U74_05695 [Alphaproteobacteria bacterium]|nr:hypothetical protein [Alphaproteobacteria bacterium]
MMDDQNTPPTDDRSQAATQQREEAVGTPPEYAAEVPQIDGSVDALVANLRAAKDQLAAVLDGAGKPSSSSRADDENEDRSAA